MIRYDEICTFEKLLEAYYQTRKGKRNKNEVIDFESNLSLNLINMREELFQRTYLMEPYYSFTIYEPKKREIFACNYRDRVMVHWLCENALIPVLSKYYIYDNAACQKGKGVHFAQNRFKQHLRNHYKKHGYQGYVLKCDIAGYFPNIDQDILIKKLRRCHFDPDILTILELIIVSFYQMEKGKGIPLGNQTSQHFALFYLSSLDVYIKEELKINYYTRYMDDFLLVHEDKIYLQKCKKEIEEFVQEKLKLTLHTKSEITPLKNGVEYLGFRFYLSSKGKVIMKLKKQSKERLKKNIKSKKYDFAQNKIQINQLENFLASYEGHSSKGNTYQLMRSLYKNCLFVKNE